MRYMPRKGRKYIENIKEKFVRTSLWKRFSIITKNSRLVVFAPGAKLTLPRPNLETHWWKAIFIFSE
jgi:hypothetical protein